MPELASPTQWAWVWANSRTWWRTGMPDKLVLEVTKSGTQLSDWTTKTISIDSGFCLIISSSAALFFCLQSFPASGSLPVSLLFIRWSKYWSFSFSISPSNEYPRLISFRIDWFDFLAVQRILNSLLQHHSLKASVLWHSTFEDTVAP